MKRVENIQGKHTEMEVIECDCGFQTGINAGHLLNKGPVVFVCAGCQKKINTADVIPVHGEKIYLSKEDVIDEITDAVHWLSDNARFEIFKQIVNKNAVLMGNGDIEIER